jgi:long-chain acyl-CoA synthetase
MSTIDSIPHRLAARAAATPDLPAFHVKVGGTWRASSWSAYALQVRRAARGLIGAGFAPGQTICILGFNRPEWVIADLAAMSAGGAPAGIYTTCSASEILYIVNHAEAPVLVLEDEGQ